MQKLFQKNRLTFKILSGIPLPIKTLHRFHKIIILLYSNLLDVFICIWVTMSPYIKITQDEGKG